MTDPSEGSSAPSWERLSELFEATVSLPVTERDAYLSRACAFEPALYTEVQALLDAADGAPAFLRHFNSTVVSPSLELALIQDATISSDATARGPLPSLSAPMQRVRHYDVLERIGAGGMGVVYRGHDTRLGRDVALKFVTPDRIADPAARRRLLREAQAASSLADANVCAVHAIEDLADGGICVVMSYCDGGTLRDRVKVGPLTVDDSLHIAMQIASGLASAHRHGIVHRDIKPANIGFDGTGAARILDFGIALQQGADITGEGIHLQGTLAYLAPEQLRAEATGSPVDVWALGVTLHEMLTGRRPFAADSEAATLHAILESSVPPLTRTDGTPIPTAVNDAVHAMLAKDPRQRPADGDAVLRMLRACTEAVSAPIVATGASSHAPTSDDVPAARGWSGRRARISALVGVLAVTAIGAAVFLRDDKTGDVVVPLEVARSSAPLPTIAVLPFTVRGSEALDYLQNGMVDLVTPAFDATGLVRGIDPNAVIGAFAAKRGTPIDSAVAHELARTLSAARYVVGSVVGTGSALTLRATLHQSTGAEAGRAQVVVSDMTQLAGGVEQLVRLLIATELRAPGDTVAGLAAVATNSASALRAYLDGERELRDARPAAAVALFQRAVADDPQFAIAWYRLARAARWSEVDSLSAFATERAYALVATLPLRLQDLVRGYHAFRFGSPQEAERRFRRIVTDYPNDVDGWMLLGETMYNSNAYYGRPTDEATAAFRRVMSLDPRNREVTVYLMTLAARADRRGELDTLFRMYFDPNSAGEQPGIRQTYLALHARRTRVSERAVEGAERIDDPAAALTALRRIDASARDLDAARVFAVRLTAADVGPAVRLDGLLALATLDAADQRWAAANAHLSEAALLNADAARMHRALLMLAPTAQAPSTVAAADSMRALRQLLRMESTAASAVRADGLTVSERDHTRRYLVGMLSVRLGDFSVAQEMQARLAADSSSVTLARPLAAALRGHLASANGDDAQAEAAFAQSVVDVPVGLRARAPVLEQHADRLARADVLLRNGKAQDAARWYASLRDGPALMAAPYLAAAEAGRRASAALAAKTPSSASP